MDIYDVDNLPGPGNDTLLYGNVYAWRAYIVVNSSSHVGMASKTNEEIPLLYTPAYWRRVDESLQVAEHRGSGKFSTGATAPFPHDAPVWNCHCGIYVYGTLRELIKHKHVYLPSDNTLMSVNQMGFGPKVVRKISLPRHRRHLWNSLEKRSMLGDLYFTVALVTVAGNCYVHEYGMRCQYVQIRKLFTAAPPDVRAKLRTHYGVPVMNYNSINTVRPPQLHGKVPLSHLQVPKHVDFEGELDGWVAEQRRNQWDK